MAKMKWYDWTAFALLTIGGINWGLVGFFNFNLVSTILSNVMAQRIVYGIVGIAGIYSLITGIRLAVK
jgi:uncharacterized membrane protein YuzA (DUF378 family)